MLFASANILLFFVIRYADKNYLVQRHIIAHTDKKKRQARISELALLVHMLLVG